MIVYGWIEQNEVSWGVESIEIEATDDIDPKDGQLMGALTDSNGRFLEGEWYDTFAHTKAAAIRHWQYQRHCVGEAIKYLRRLRKKDVK